MGPAIRSAMSRPEHIAPPEIFYSGNEARKYATCSRVQFIQKQMSERAIELLQFPDDDSKFILDIGCGSGLSGESLTEAGHQWVGFDISTAMLELAIDNEVEGDIMLHDAGQGFHFRAGSFDAAISVSAIQWLCNADVTDNVPYKRLMIFFQSLYSCLRRGGRAVFQFYPESAHQVEMITSTALRCGFKGGVVIDFPNSSKAKKYYLVLHTGGGDFKPPEALASEHESKSSKGQSGVDFIGTKLAKGKKGRRPDMKNSVKSREWIMSKKDKQARRGKEKIAADSKFTGRKRKNQRGF